MITIKIRKVVSFERKEWLQLGWDTWRGFWVVVKVWFLDLVGENEVDVHFIMIF